MKVFFCVNQAAPEKRYEKFEEAVKQIFASTMNEDALGVPVAARAGPAGRADGHTGPTGIGAYRKSCFFPELAGVGLSHNPYVWKEHMDPGAGMLRIVLGLGTRAVNRVENDYPRIVAMDDPVVKPLAGMWELKKYSQHYVDYLNLEDNELQTISLNELAAKKVGLRLDAIAVRDRQTQSYGTGASGPAHDQWIITFDPFFTQTRFTEIMAAMLKRLEEAYTTPVEIEFTVNYDQEDEIQINLLQCRPFQTIGNRPEVGIPEKIPPADIFIKTKGNFMGGNVSLTIDAVIWVDPIHYTALSMPEKYSVARLIGKLNRQVARPPRTDHHAPRPWALGAHKHRPWAFR